MVNLIYRSSSTASKPAGTSVKSAPLTNLEIDGNFKSIQDGINTILDGTSSLASPSLTGIPTAPTAAVNTNTTQLATTAFVIAQIADDAPPVTLIDDVSTNTSQYLTMARSNTGELNSSYVASTKLYFNPNTGALNATDFNSLSDATQKKNVNDINDAIGIVNQLRGVEFEWVDNNKMSSGVIAQDLEKILPHLVETNDNGIKSVNYNGLIAYLIESIKQLSNKIETLETK